MTFLPVYMQSSYVDPIMVMYRGSSKVDEIIQRIISEEEPVELLPGVKKDLEKSQDHYEHYLWTVQLPDVRILLSLLYRSSPDWLRYCCRTYSRCRRPSLTWIRCTSRTVTTALLLPAASTARHRGSPVASRPRLSTPPSEHPSF